jgi:hypothetical protein
MLIEQSDAAVQLERLEGALFGGEARPLWTANDGRKFATALRFVRRHAGTTAARRLSPLPPLNPANAATTSDVQR